MTRRAETAGPARCWSATRLPRHLSESPQWPVKAVHILVLTQVMAWTLNTPRAGSAATAQEPAFCWHFTEQLHRSLVGVCCLGTNNQLEYWPLYCTAIDTVPPLLGTLLVHTWCLLIGRTRTSVHVGVSGHCHRRSFLRNRAPGSPMYVRFQPLVRGASGLPRTRGPAPTVSAGFPVRAHPLEEALRDGRVEGMAILPVFINHDRWLLGLRDNRAPAPPWRLDHDHFP